MYIWCIYICIYINIPAIHDPTVATKDNILKFNSNLNILFLKISNCNTTFSSVFIISFKYSSMDEEIHSISFKYVSKSVSIIMMSSCVIILGAVGAEGDGGGLGSCREVVEGVVGVREDWLEAEVVGVGVEVTGGRRV